MTIVTDDSPGEPLHLDAIPVIDLRVLSQSELNSLSLCSDNAFDLHRCEDVIIPKLDRSVFNESAGSRKQTYSRLRLAPRKPEISAVGRGRYNPVTKPHTNPVDDPERKENKEIVSLLRELFGKDSSIQFKEKNLELFNEDYENNEFVQEESFLPMVSEVPMHVPAPTSTLSIMGTEDGIVKRKRGRPKKEVVNFEHHESKLKVRKVEIDDYYENVATEENVVMEIVNINGVVVDLAALASSEDPFGPELRKRSAGLTTEEELLAFLRELKGQWGSRRKKRKVVDASDFGDALPLGWKLLLSLKRKEGRLSLYCRRYISPTGQQFASCKEVSSFLLPFFGFEGEDHPNSFLSEESDYETGKLSSGSSAGHAHRDESTKDELMYYEASPVGSSSSEPEKQHALLGTENLAEVEIRDLLECHICKMNFDEKDAYLQHLLSSHQRSSKRSRHSNTSVCDGVIIKDGKYECQFCHKIFDEKHRYNGHVGVHVRNYVRSLESTGGTTPQINLKSSSVSRVLPGTPGLDAPADSDKGSVPMTSVSGNEKATQANVESSSASRVLPERSRVEASDNIEKGTVAETPICDGITVTQDNAEKGTVPETPLPTVEISIQDKVEASNPSRLEASEPSTVEASKPSRIEASDNVEKGIVPQTPLPSDETMQDKVELSSVNGVLSGFNVIEASTAGDKGSVPLTPLPSDETMQDNVELSSVNVVLSEFNGIEASTAIDKGSVPLKFIPRVEASDNIENGTIPQSPVPSDEKTMHDNVDPSSVNRVFSVLNGIDASASIDKGFVSSSSVEKGTIPQSLIPSDERTVQDNVDPSSVNRVFSGFKGIEASAAIDKGFVPLSSMPSGVTPSLNNVKRSSEGAVCPGFPSIEVLAENDKISVPPTLFHNNELKAGSPHELDMDSNTDASTVKPNSEQDLHHSKQNTETYVPQSLLANPILENVDSFHDNMGRGTSPENSTSTSNFEHSVGSLFSKHDNGANITDESVGEKSGEKQDTDIEIDAKLGKADQTGDSGSRSIPQSSASISSCEVNVGSCSEQDIGDNKIDDTSGEESSEKQNGDIHMTDGILGRVDMTINNPNVELRSFLDSSVVLCNNDEDGSPETFNGKDVLTSTNEGYLGKVDGGNNTLVGDFRSFLGSPGTLRSSVDNRANVTFEGSDFLTSTTIGKLGKSERTNNDLDGDFRSFLGSAGTLRNNRENCSNVTYEGNDFFTRSAVDVNNPNLHQGQGSFSFSFAPSVSKKARGVEFGKDEFLSISMKNPELDRSNEYGFGGPDRRFGTNMNLYNEGSAIHSIESAGRETMLQRLMADTSSPSLQSSGCFTTLDLMSNKRFVADTSSQMLQSSGCFPTLDLMSNKRLIADTSSSLLQSSDCFPTLDLMSNRGQVETENFNLQKFDNMSGFDELGFDDLDSSTKYGFVTGKESASLTHEPMDISYDSVLEDALNTSVPFEWESMLPNNNQHQHHQQQQQSSTICVWCRMPFNHDAINPEMQSDSVGFMCPTCKTRISGQINVLDNDGFCL